MIKNEKTNSLSPIDFDDIYQTVPLLRDFKFPIESVSFENPIDSSDICPSDWDRIAEVIFENYDKYDGFVVLHGTDTMAYTASALSFIFNNLSKPVIITGSQLPIRMIRSDGRDNLVTSIEIAAHKRNGVSLINEVCIYFEDKLYRGNRTTKFSTETFDAFTTVNYPELANSGVHLTYNYSAINKADLSKPTTINKGFNTDVTILKLFPGITARVIESILNTKNLRGVVIESYGAGNAPTQDWFFKLIKEAREKGIIIINVSQCTSGSVEMNIYEAGLKMQKAGVIDGKSMTTEAAITKLMHVLNHDLPLCESEKLLKESLKGEM